MPQSSPYLLSRKRIPLLWAFIPMALGLVFASTFASLPIFLPIFLLFLTHTLLWIGVHKPEGVHGFIHRHGSIQNILLVIGYWAIGCLWLLFSIEKDEKDFIANWSGFPPREVEVRIEVTKVQYLLANEESGTLRFQLEGQFREYMPSSSWLDSKAFGFARCYGEIDRPKSPISSGSILELQGVLVPPEGLSSPHFVLRANRLLEIYPGSKQRTIEAVRLSSMDRIVDVLKIGLPETEKQSMILSMITGNKGYLRFSEKQLFSELGIMHFFAISGFHLSVVGGLIYMTLRMMRLGRRWCGVGMLLFCGGYVWVTGFPVSAQRAWIMMLFFVGSGWVGRKPEPLACTFAAAIGILILDPWSLFSSGYQLSFMVVIAILTQAIPLSQIFRKPATEQKWDAVLETNPIIHFFKWLGNAIWSIFSVSWIAFFMSAPLIAYMNGSVAMGAVVLNALLVPICSIAMITAFLSIGCGIVGLEMGCDFLNHGLLLLIRLMEVFVNWGDIVIWRWQTQVTFSMVLVSEVVMIGAGIILNMSNPKYRLFFLITPLVSVLTLCLGTVN